MRHKGRKSVLIVDNNERVLWTFEEMLENAGFDTRTTWSGHEALALLQSQDFDVLLVDDYLPDLHASDFLDRVGRLPIQPWIVVMQGTPPTPGDLRHYESLGASATVDKLDRAKVAEAVSYCCAEEPLAKAVAS
jgi:CheY-like chemotaxis protein